MAPDTVCLLAGPGDRWYYLMTISMRGYRVCVCIFLFFVFFHHSRGVNGFAHPLKNWNNTPWCNKRTTKKLPRRRMFSHCFPYKILQWELTAPLAAKDDRQDITVLPVEDQMCGCGRLGRLCHAKLSVNHAGIIRDSCHVVFDGVDAAVACVNRLLPTLRGTRTRCVYERNQNQY